MATMLRSLRFIRRLNAGSRRLGASPLNRAPSAAAAAAAQSSSTLAQSSALRANWRCCVASLHQDRNYVTKAAVDRKLDTLANANVDDMLREVDQKTKKYGLVYKADLNDILDAVIMRGTVTPTQILLMIRCCGYFMLRETLQDRQEFVNKIWETSKKLNVPMDVSHYNALLLVYLDNETDFSPLEILIEMKEKNIAPNRVTFQRLIEQYCIKGDVAGATKILEHMSENEIPLNENIFNSLIMCHSEANDIASALKILDIMKQANIEPTSSTYSAVMCAHAKKGDIVSIQTVLKQCKDNEVMFSDKDILAVVYTLAVNKYYDYIDEMLLNVNKGGNYNLRALAYVCKLLDRHDYEAAYKIQKSLVKALHNYSDNDSNKADGYLFMKKLILNKSDADTVVKYCKLMIKDQASTAPFDNALFIAYKNNLHHLAMPLLKAMTEEGCAVREHYFYPLFASYAKADNLQGILNTVSSMMTDFKITPLIVTVKDYVLPYMTDNSMDNLTVLLKHNLSFFIATNAIYMQLLENNKTHQAVNFLKETKMHCRTGLLEIITIHSFINTKDVNDLMYMLHHYCTNYNKSIDEQEGDENYESTYDFQPEKSLNRIINGIVDKLNPYDVEIVSNILKGLSKRGLSITQSTADRIKRRLGSNATSEIENSLSELASSKMEPQPLLSNPSEKRNRRFTSRDLERLESKAESSLDYKFILIQEHTLRRDHESVEKLLEELKEQNPTYPTGFCVSLINYYSKIYKMEEAEKWWNILHETDPDCKLHKTKVLNYAIVLIRNKRYSDALKVLEHATLDSEMNRENLCEKLMDMVDQSCPDQSEAFLKKLEDCKYFTQATGNLLGPIIKYYVNINDVEKAVEKFKWACETYKVTPCKKLLLKKLIQDEDAKTLQYVTGLCSQIYGESNALCDLAFCFLECNKPKQARKILEIPGVRLRSERILYAGRGFVIGKNTENFEKFIQLVSGLRYDVSPLCDMLLQLYEQENDYKKSLALWTQMQEDNVQPSVQFMDRLENILRACNQEIPFAKSNHSPIDVNIQLFSDSLNRGQLSEAKEILQNVPEKIRATYALQLIDRYLDAGNVDEALSNLKDFWEMDHKIFPQFRDTVTSVLQKLKDSNDFQGIEQVMSDAQQFCKKFKKSFALTYVLNKIYYESNDFEDLWKYVESKAIENESDAKNVLLLYHSVTSMKFLLDKPELEDRFKAFADKVAKFDMWEPMNTLWMYKFLTDSPDAASFREKNLKVFYSLSAVYACKDIGAWHKVPQICSMLIDSPYKYDVKRKNVTLMLNILLESDATNKYDLALECLRIAVKEIPLDVFNTKFLKEIKENCTVKEAFNSLRPNENTKPRSQEAVTA